MNRKLLTSLALAAVFSVGATAQRAQTPDLDRGLVAVKTSSGVFCSWRIPGDEYYDVTYNIYRDGAKLNDQPLTVSNYMDTGGSTSSTYTVSAVVLGVEQAQCDAVSTWENNYLEITPDHGDLESTFEPNDATIADVDGDGEMELIIKFVNTTYSGSDYSTDATEFDIIECYKLDGTKLWWIDCGPNMTDFQSNEINIAAFDWDGDGKAECVMRAADNTIIHKADGTSVVVGDPTVDTRSELVHGSGTVFTHTGDEFLLYFEGATGDLYFDPIEYPLKRLESSETDLADAWGDGYGHRSSKHFFGAPYLNGRTPSIFLARGIYTRHKMIAYDVDPSTHELSVRWKWNCSTSGSSWYGQGYHNYSIADVDWDGRDEIVFGSMVIDDNGKGLSTSGLGHGDAHHVSDFNPYVHGSEMFACNEDEPANNYRDATTSKIYYRETGDSDDGRSLCGNFCNDYLGAMGYSGHFEAISCVTNTYVSGLSKNNLTGVNFRIYWDGDLQEESFDGYVYKYNEGQIATLDGALMNNSTKNTPCLQADIFGDWREEVVARTSSGNIRIYTTTDETEWRNYTLMDDHQYRNAIVHQMNGYNQPPHVSYFLGELENITVAPPPVITRGREEVAAGGTIGSTYDGEHVFLAETGDATVAVSEGAAPYIFTDNAPSWVQGNDDNDAIVYEYYTHTLTGSAFTGSMRLVKQGDGALVLPEVEETYTGNTDVWAGQLYFDGTMKSSPVWLNRFTELHTSGTFNREVRLEYDAKLYPGGAGTQGTATIDTLTLGFGSKVYVDLFSSDASADVLNIDKLTIETFSAATDVLPYDHPVIVMNAVLDDDASTLPAGQYLIANIGSVSGSIDNLSLTGADGMKASLVYSENKLYIEIAELRDPETIYWVGDKSDTWDFAETYNFVDEDGNEAYFVTGDQVVFSDNAVNGTVVISETLKPGSVLFSADKVNFSISGDSLVGSGYIKMTGAGQATISNVNHLTGGTTISKGRLIVTSLANSSGEEYGALGGVDAGIVLSGGTLQTSGTVACSQSIIVTGNDTIYVPSGSLTMSAAISGTSTSVWYKAGSGSLTLTSSAVNGGVLHVLAGTVYGGETSSSVHSYPSTVYLDGGAIVDVNNLYSYSSNSTNFIVPSGATASWTRDSRCTYTGTLTGSGTLNLKAAGTRDFSSGDWSDFEGTINISSSDLFFTNSYGLQNAKVNVSSSLQGMNPQSSTYYDMKIGSLSGSGTVLSGSSKTVTVGYRNEDCSFSGTISGCKFAKTGTGTLTLTSVQSSLASSTVNINGGTVQLSPSTSAASTKFFGNNTVYVNSGGTIAGYATLADVYVNSGGLLIAGNNASSSYSYYSTSAANFYFTGGSAKFCVRNFNNAETSRSYLSATSQIYIDETVTFDVYFGSSMDPDVVGESTLISILDNAIAAGKDSVVLWTAKTFYMASGSEIELNLPDLPSGYEWDTTDLYQATGILRVKSTSSAVRIIEASADVDCEVYNVAGVKVAGFSAVRSSAESTARSKVRNTGIFILVMRSGAQTESVKLIVR